MAIHILYILPNGERSLVQNRLGHAAFLQATGAVHPAAQSHSRGIMLRTTSSYDSHALGNKEKRRRFKMGIGKGPKTKPCCNNCMTTNIVLLVAPTTQNMLKVCIRSAHGCPHSFTHLRNHEKPANPPFKTSKLTHTQS
eukprot:scaffold29751_cov25-Tisochrysis_lutea.AAC.2